MKTDYGTEVKLIAITYPEYHIGDSMFDKSVNNCEHLIEYAGRLCYNMQDKLGTNPDWIQDRIKDGHESIIEHASASFYIRCSRVVTHELVRHRIASYSQRSQRYVNESKPTYITPPGIFNSELNLIFTDIMDKCWSAYNELLRQGIPKEIARYVLPNACQTDIITTMNFRELRHFIKLRTSKRALPEMQEVAGKVKDICKQIAPKVFGDL